MLTIQRIHEIDLDDLDDQTSTPNHGVTYRSEVRGDYDEIVVYGTVHSPIIAFKVYDYWCENDEAMLFISTKTIITNHYDDKPEKECRYIFFELIDSLQPGEVQLKPFSVMECATFCGKMNDLFSFMKYSELSHLFD